MYDFGMDIEHACSIIGPGQQRSNISVTVPRWLEEQIRKAIAEGYTDFITGLQQGVDICAAEIILSIKDEGKPIRLFYAIAWNDMECEWEQSWRDRYRNIVGEEENGVIMATGLEESAFFERNCWMIDHSSRLVVVNDDVSEETKETILYAKDTGREVVSMKND